MKWREIVGDYLSFSRRERIGILVILILILTVILIPTLFKAKSISSQTLTADTAWIAAAKRLEIKEKINKDRKPQDSKLDDGDFAHQYDRKVNPATSALTLFVFDPNTLDKAGWEKLGLKEKIIRTIQNYLDKGGHFYKPDDLKRIYGLPAEDYGRLEPFIKIEGNVSADKSREFVKRENEPKRFTYSSVDINSADTTAFIALPGIGAKLAARIVSFRDKLGGFYSVDQVAETYGLADSTFKKIRQYLKLETFTVKKINVNTATVDELKAHPYMRYNVANPIVAYRNEHGLFSKLEDIKKVMAINDEVYNKIAPYLRVQ